MWGVPRLCALLALLRWANTVSARCPTFAPGPRDVRHLDCHGRSEADFITCTINGKNGFICSNNVKRSEQMNSTGSWLLELPLGGLDSVLLLTLNRVQLSVVPSVTLSQLPNLRTLTMNFNQIGELRQHQLESLPRLRSLSLVGNALQRLERGALPATLKRIGLRGNQLRTLNGTVRHLRHLKWLMVSNNGLTTLRAQLPASGWLDTLLASGNRLTSLDGVQDASQLLTLSVASNRLRSIGRLRLPRLSRLNVTHNRIRQVSVEQLANLPSLKYLDLDGNQLSEVGGLLAALPALIKLSLSHNRLNSIAKLTSDRHQGRMKPHPLQELCAGANRIVSIGQLNLPKLLELNLADNRLTQVSEANFVGMPSLEVLVLSGNRLQHIGQLLRALPALTSADFSSNSIGSVSMFRSEEQQPHETKPRLMNLRTLLLNNNSLRLLDVSLYRLPALCVLDVRNNDISQLRWHQHQAWRCSRPHSRLHLNGNPMQCEDEEVRLSLKRAALSFSLDVAPCSSG